LCELELELKLGPREALFELASRLVDALPAQLAVRSKAERGYELLDDAEAAPSKAPAVDLSPQMSVADGLRAIGRSCLKQVANNVLAVQLNDPEGVHEMRVGLRRLRSAISLFGDILPDPQTATIKREAKWLTGELAPARELDVLVNRVVLPVRQRCARLPGLATMSHELLERRGRALERARDAIGSPRFRRLLLDVAAWLETGEWAKPRDDLLLDRIEAPIATYAASELARPWRKIRKKGKALRELDAHARHKLRIQGKRLRYASEFFATLFSGRKAARRRRSFMSRLKQLQNALGDLNDIRVHENLVKANAGLDGRATPVDASRKRAYAAGVLTGYEDARFENVLAGACKAASALRRTKSFW
jgi:triphosphatase